MKVAQLCLTVCDPMDYAVLEFSRPEYWNWEPVPSPGDLPNKIDSQFSSVVYPEVALAVKNLPVNAGDVRDGGFDPWVRKILWKRNWHPTQYLCLENPVD